MAGELKIFGGRAHPALVAEICDYLNLEAGKVSAFNFSDGETFCQVEENVRGSDVFIVQPTCGPVNENLMELLIMLDSFKRSSASRVTAVIPYYGYARQDKKIKPREPVTAKLIADLLERVRANRILAVDLHAGQIQGFFNIPVDHLYASPAIADYLIKREIPDLVVVSPDAGGVERARAIAKRLGAGLAIIDKRRTAPNEAEVMHLIGDVDGCNALVVDDIIDTAGTLAKSVDALKAKGANRVLAAGVHGILSGPAIKRIAASPLEMVLITNTTPVDDKLAKLPKLRPLSVAPLLGEAIRRIHENSSVSSLFV